MEIRLSDLKIGQSAKILGFSSGSDAYQKKMSCLGLVPDLQFTVTHIAPLGDPILIQTARGTLCLRKKEAEHLKLERIAPISSLGGKLDKIVLNRILGIPIFLLVIYAMFVFSVHIAGIFQDFFNILSETLFVTVVADALSMAEFPNWVTAFLAEGVGRGINTTVTFIPVIAGMFFALSFLESSGYMARAAFVMDRVMQFCGLPGKSFVPMILGFGCNVPAIMGTRILDNKNERILTIMMTPFMSCSARLAIYAMVVAAFFPLNGQNVIFALYLIGVIMALLTGFLLRKWILKGKTEPFLMELPNYRWPSFSALCKTTIHRLKRFLIKAGAFIIPLCALIGTLGAFKALPESSLAAVGRAVTPIFAPMGIKEDNWPATVGLLSGILAKEVMVGTLSALYLQVPEAEAEAAVKSQAKSLSHSLKLGFERAVTSIHENSQQVKNAILSPFYKADVSLPLQEGVKQKMVDRFGGGVNAFAYLLFVLLYFPCVSVVASIAKELNKRWAAFSVFWTTGIAYSISVLFYQMATVLEHPFSSILWAVGLVFIWGVGIWWVKGQLKVETNVGVSVNAKVSANPNSRMNEELTSKLKSLPTPIVLT